MNGYGSERPRRVDVVGHPRRQRGREQAGKAQLPPNAAMRSVARSPKVLRSWCSRDVADHRLAIEELAEHAALDLGGRRPANRAGPARDRPAVAIRRGTLARRALARRVPARRSRHRRRWPRRRRRRPPSAGSPQAAGAPAHAPQPARPAAPTSAPPRVPRSAGSGRQQPGGAHQQAGQHGAQRRAPGRRRRRTGCAPAARCALPPANRPVNNHVQTYISASVVSAARRRRRGCATGPRRRRRRQCAPRPAPGKPPPVRLHQAPLQCPHRKREARWPSTTEARCLLSRPQSTTPPAMP